MSMDKPITRNFWFARPAEPTANILSHFLCPVLFHSQL
jgi:hypothetical protein